jgi:DNA-binding MarR family transcriptional regulator
MKVESLQMADHFYLRFLERSRVIHSAPGAPKITPSETQLLQAVAMHDLENKHLSVRDAMSLSHLDSPATLHKRLVQLRSMGLVDIQHRVNDRRTKYLVTTPLAQTHFENLGEALHNALSQETPAA